MHIKPKAIKWNVCDKAVGTNGKRVKCDVCHNLMHVSYLNISKHQQKKLHCKNYSFDDMQWMFTINATILQDERS